MRRHTPPLRSFRCRILGPDAGEDELLLREGSRHGGLKRGRHEDGEGQHDGGEGRHEDGDRHEDGEGHHDGGEGRHEDGEGRHEDGEGTTTEERADRNAEEGKAKEREGIARGPPTMVQAFPVPRKLRFREADVRRLIETGYGGFWTRASELIVLGSKNPRPRP